jgi:hypothetical protein
MLVIFIKIKATTLYPGGIRSHDPQLFGVYYYNIIHSRLDHFTEEKNNLYSKNALGYYWLSCNS